MQLKTVRWLALFTLLAIAHAAVALAQTPTPTPCGNTYSVDSTGDDPDISLGDGYCATACGECTLRAALQEAAMDDCRDTIEFEILTSGQHVIALEPPLPFFESPIIIDGTTQEGSSCGDLWSGTVPIWNIKLDLNGGTLAISGDNSIVKGLEVVGSLEVAIIIGGDHNIVQCNYIHGNGGHGIETGNATHASDNLIGGDNPGEGNVVSGNGRGIECFGDDNRIIGNFIGTDPSGAVADPNASLGIKLEDAHDGSNAAIVRRNLIAGHSDAGIEARGADHELTLNVIGLDRSGLYALGNARGIIVEGSNIVVGGSASLGNVVSASGTGMLVTDTAEDTEVSHNYFGTTADGDSDPGLCNFLNISDQGSNTSVTQNVEDPECVGRCCTIFNAPAEFPAICMDGPIIGSFDGQQDCQDVLDTTGWGALATSFNLGSNCATPGNLFSACLPAPTPTPCSVFMVGSTADDSDDVVGDGACDTGSGACTLRAAIQEANSNSCRDRISFAISGSGQKTITAAAALPSIVSPVVIDGTSQAGASCGSLWTGTAPTWQIKLDLNANTGIVIDADHVHFKGVELVNASGNGVAISGEYNIVQCNYVHENEGHGIIINASYNRIGGTDAGDGNVISGNGRGVQCFAHNNVITGNFIGSGPTGSSSDPNESGGIKLEDTTGGTSHTLVSKNLIVGHTDSGIEAQGALHHIVGNVIGVSPFGSTPLGNRNGVVVQGSSIVVGGVGNDAGNTISAGGRGVWITSAADDATVRGNNFGQDVSGDPGVGLCNYRNIDDQGSGTVIADNSPATECTPWCCAVSGAPPEFPLTCIDGLLVGPITSVGGCQDVLDNAQIAATAGPFNGTTNCSVPGDVFSSCPPPPTPTP